MWPITLSGRLPIIALVGHYPTNKLMGREPLLQRPKALKQPISRTAYYGVLAPLSQSYPPLKGRLPTCYSPVCHFTHHPKVAFTYDLHVLGTPPAFILSQDQTLQLNPKLTRLALFKETPSWISNIITQPVIFFASFLRRKLFYSFFLICQLFFKKIFLFTPLSSPLRIPLIFTFQISSAIR